MVSRAERGEKQNIRLFNRDGWRCVYCGFDGDGPHAYGFLELDHIDPSTKTADDFLESQDYEKTTVCVYCNKLKGSYVPVGSSRHEKLRDARIHVQAQRGQYEKWYFSAREQ